MDVNKRRKILYVLVILGLIIAAYETVDIFNPSVFVCPPNGIFNCGDVLSSPYSSILGIPLSALGFILMLLAIPMIQKSNDVRFFWSIAAAGALLYSVVSMAIIGHICEWCSALDAVILSTIVVANMKASGSVIHETAHN
ncbi:MAG: hypothetical protein M1504_03570 [Candidatus Marsarchaeota archaeon]|nr:hypothetical protein [Candidatus Marsarchaeota archaeon]